MPSIDIAVPCYNYSQFLRDCVTSILSQDFRDLRILISDNASTDDSLDVARRLASEDPRIEVFSHPKNLGPHANYNFCVDWASADYFHLIDADDLLAPGAITRAVRTMEQNSDLAFTYGGELRLEFGPGVMPQGAVDQRGGENTWHVVPGEAFIRHQAAVGIYPGGPASAIVGPSTVIRRTRVQKAAGHYRDSLKFYDDWELWLRLATFGDVASTGAIQAVRRLHPGAHSVHYYENPAADYFEREAVFRSFFANEGKAFPDKDALLRRMRSTLAAKTYWSGLSHICRGHVRPGLDLMKFCLQRRPAMALLPPLAHLVQMGRPFERLKDIVLETVTGRPHGHWLRNQETAPPGFVEPKRDPGRN